MRWTMGLLKNPVEGRFTATGNGCSMPVPPRGVLATGYGYATDTLMWLRLTRQHAQKSRDGSDAASRLRLMAAAVR